jgi:hypothetical protein
MRALRRRLLRNLLITAGMGLAALGVVEVLEMNQRDTALYSGWVLFTLVVVLTLYNARKRLTMLPIGRAAHWLQVHLYVGWLSLLMFMIHLDWSIPNGVLETALAVTYVLVAFTGVFGIFISRLVPRQLTRGGEEILLERVPAFVARLRSEAEALVITAARETGSSSLSDHYADNLAAFFSGPGFHHLNFLTPFHVRFSLETDLDELSRYLAPKERDYLWRLRTLVTKKDEVDHQHALQWIMRAWLLVHVPATYAMLLLAILHLVLAHAFGGNIG